VDLEGGLGFDRFFGSPTDENLFDPGPQNSGRFAGFGGLFGFLGSLFGRGF